MTLKNLFDTLSGSTTYRIKFQYKVSYPTFPASPGVTVSITGTGVGDVVLLTNATYDSWIGVDTRVVIPVGYKNMFITAAAADPLATSTLLVKNLQAFKISKAEVQDTDMQRAGRRTSYYEGTKITSTDINVDSPDTVDGGPVITVNTVGSTTPSSNQIGSSTDGKTLSNISIPSVDGRALVNRAQNKT